MNHWIISNIAVDDKCERSWEVCFVGADLRWVDNLCYCELLFCTGSGEHIFFALMITSIQPLPVQSKHSLSKLFSTENNLDCFGLSVMSLRVQFSGQWYLELKNAVSTSVCLDEFWFVVPVNCLRHVVQFLLAACCLSWHLFWLANNKVCSCWKT